MSQSKPKINSLQIKKYITFLKEQERAVSTIRKYEHDLLLFCAYLKEAPLTKEKLIDWKRVLFVPTGALLSKTSFNEGKSVPGIAHAVMLESLR